MNPRSALSSKLRVGVLFGGSSSERKISIYSGRAVQNALKRAGFQTLSLDPRNRERLAKQREKIDLAFVALHGRGGEDGEIQKQLEQWKIPYVGSGPAGSWNAFNKRISKNVFRRNGIPTPPFLFLNFFSNWRRKLGRFSAPFVVKPLCEGSSIGVFMVEDLKHSAEKIKRALDQYGQLLVERRIQGREFTVGILGSKPLPVVELKPKRKFYDYRAKYTKGMTDYVVPAKISGGLKKKLQVLALRVHKSLGLRDFSRVDMMVDELGNPYVLEANSIPGFTEFSLLPKAARAAGLSFEGLCRRLVWMGCRRGKKLDRTAKRQTNGKKKA